MVIFILNIYTLEYVKFFNLKVFLIRKINCMSNSVDSLPRIPLWRPIAFQIKTEALTVVYKVLHEVTLSFLSRVILYHKPCLLETKNSVGEMRERHLTSHLIFQDYI